MTDGIFSSRLCYWIPDICSGFCSSYWSSRQLSARLSSNHRLNIILKENVVCMPPLIPRYASQPTTVDGSVPYRRLVYRMSERLKSPTTGFIFVAPKSYCNNLVTFQHGVHFTKCSVSDFMSSFISVWIDAAIMLSYKISFFASSFSQFGFY